MSKARLVITAVVRERRSQGEVARAYGVSQGWVSRLVARYRAEGEAAFGPRSRKPRTSPRAIPETTVQLIMRLRKELAGQGLDAGPDTIAWHLQHRHRIRVSAATISRYLARAGLVVPEPRKRPKSSYLRFEAEQPNECWQADFTHYPLADGSGTEILTWLDDHSPLRDLGHRPHPGERADRARCLPRRTRSPQCAGLNADGHSTASSSPAGSASPAPPRCCSSGSAAAMASACASLSPARRPRPGKSNGGTRVCRTSCSTTLGPSPAWRKRRPRLMSGGRSTTTGGRTSPWTWRARPRGSGLHPATMPAWHCGRPRPGARHHHDAGTGGVTRRGRAYELAGCHRSRPGRPSAGEHDDRTAAVLAWDQPGRPERQLLDRHHHRAHMSIGGWRIKTVPSRLSAVDLARLRNAGAKAAGPPPAGHAPGVLAAASCAEVQRLVNSAGIITLGGQVIQVGSPLAGQRARIRLDGQVMHVITQGGILWRTLACPIPPGPAAQDPGRPPGRARSAPGCAADGPADGVQPRRHPGCPAAHPGRH